MIIHGRIKERSGCWYCVASWTDTQGKRHFKEKTTKLPVANNKRKAEAMLQDFIHEVEDFVQNEQAAEAEGKDKLCAVETMDFSDFASLWLSSIEGSVDEVTFEWYAYIVNSHIIPYFQKHPVLVGDISQEILQAYFNEKKNSGRLHGKGGLSAKSLKSHKVTLGNILKMAYTAHGKFNPIQNVKIPKDNTESASFYSVQQCRELLRALENEPIYYLVKATLFLGLRRSEVLGLQWDAINFKKRTLTIKRTVVRKVNNEICRKDRTKSNASTRVYYMPDIILKLFQEVKEEEDKNREFFGNTYMETPYVFKWPNGEPYKPEWVRKAFRAQLKKHGLPIIRFHDLRHSCASILYSAGIGVKEIQAWLGHSSSQITMDTYTHLFRDSNKQISEHVNTIFSTDSGLNDP